MISCMKLFVSFGLTNEYVVSYIGNNLYGFDGSIAQS